MSGNEEKTTDEQVTPVNNENQVTQEEVDKMRKDFLNLQKSLITKINSTLNTNDVGTAQLYATLYATLFNPTI